MATTFPASVDSYTPASGGTLLLSGGKSHTERHTDVEDAIVALETAFITTANTPIADLAGGATLADVITKVNVVLAMLRSKNLIDT